MSLRDVICVLTLLLVVTCVFLASGCASPGEHMTAWMLGAPVKEGDSYVLELTEGQQGDCLGAYYTIIWSGLPDYVGYYAAVDDVPAEIDESGRVLVPGDPKVLKVTSDGGEDEILCKARCVADEGSSLMYESDSLRFRASEEISAIAPSMAGFEDISLQARVDTETDAVRVEMTRTTGTYPLGAKVECSQLGHYRAIQNLWRYCRGKTRSQDGTLAPFSEWEEGGVVSSGVCRYDRDFEFVLAPVSTLNLECFLQVTVKDAEGNLHASELAKLETLGRSDEEDVRTVETTEGTLSFSIDEGQAILTRYEGEDWSVAVPGTVEGCAVVAVGETAFANNEYVHEVLLPESVIELGYGAFRNSRITRFQVPGGLRSLGESVFAGCRLLEAFVQDGPGSATSVRDGVLYSADGSRLLAFPSAKGAEYLVPEGVQSIGRTAFESSAIERVLLPESLREIEPAAFLDCRRLGKTVLPEGLESIGASAFRLSRYGSSGKDDPQAGENGWWDTVRIGRDVSYVGGCAFGGRLVEGYEVDPDNELYEDWGGFLVSEDGTLLEAPSGLRGPIQVPDGVVSLASGSLADFEARVTDSYAKLVDIVLSDTVREIQEGALPTMVLGNDTARYSGESVCGARLHVAPGSWAEHYAKDNEIEYDYLRSADDLSWHTSEVSVKKGTLTFRVHPRYAELVRIDAQDAGHIEVPELVEGVPVTVIGADDQDDVVGTVITLIIPQSVESIRGTLLTRAETIRRFELKEGNEHFSIREGAICSADGKMLLVCPKQDAEEYVVPDDIAVIGPSAFSNVEVESIIFPEGVERIEDSAFHGCDKLKQVSFPPTLERIGSEAFYFVNLEHLELTEGLVTIGFDAFSRVEEYDTLVIPDSVKEVGTNAFASSSDDSLTPVASRKVQIGKGLETVEDGAFAGLDIDGFVVSPDNPYLKAEGPLLLSKDGRILHACAGAAGPIVHVPEGVEVIRPHAFSAVPTLTDIYLPDSLYRMESYGIHSGQTELITLHCAADSEAALIARAEGFMLEET